MFEEGFDDLCVDMPSGIDPEDRASAWALVRAAAVRMADYYLRHLIEHVQAQVSEGEVDAAVRYVVREASTLDGYMYDVVSGAAIEAIHAARIFFPPPPCMPWDVDSHDLWDADMDDMDAWGGEGVSM